jgi:formylglycine-generating enzyme required for sulfatase activity
MRFRVRQSRKGAQALCLLAVVGLGHAAMCQVRNLPGGTFVMGDENGENDERPEHEVRVPPFAIDIYEATAAEYDSCVARKACSPAHYEDGKCLMWSAGGIARVTVPPQYRLSTLPVVCVTWQQAREYCSFRNKRLPTEAEWEYAAAAGAATAYSWGNQRPDESRCARVSHRRPLKGGGFAPNGFGLYDMTGNVWEWTADRYQTDYYSENVSDNPQGPPVGRYRVIRGGGWYSEAKQLRLRNRQWFVPEYGEVSIGFRCVK